MEFFKRQIDIILTHYRTTTGTNRRFLGFLYGLNAASTGHCFDAKRQIKRPDEYSDWVQYLVMATT